jgi:hypothetical protein
VISDDLLGSGSGLITRYYPGIRLDGLRKMMKAVSKDSRFPGRDFDSGPPEYEAGVLTTRQLYISNIRRDAVNINFHLLIIMNSN